MFIFAAPEAMRTREENVCIVPYKGHSNVFTKFQQNLRLKFANEKNDLINMRCSIRFF